MESTDQVESQQSSENEEEELNAAEQSDNEQIDQEGQDEIMELKNQLKELEQTLKQQEQEGEFLDAEGTWKEIQETREAIKKAEEENLKARHEQENESIEELQARDVELLTEKWENKISEYEEACEAALEELQEQQEREMESKENMLNESLPQNPKFSSKFLNLKKIQANMVKQKNYREAHQVQQEIQQLEEKETTEHEKRREAKIQVELKKLKAKHNNEINNFKMRQESGKYELEGQMKVELEQLERHYANLRKEANIVQKYENKCLHGKIKSQAGRSLNKSKMSNLIKSASKSSFGVKLLKNHDQNSPLRSTRSKSPPRANSKKFFNTQDNQDNQSDNSFKINVEDEEQEEEVEQVDDESED